MNIIKFSAFGLILAGMAGHVAAAESAVKIRLRQPASIIPFPKTQAEHGSIVLPESGETPQWLMQADQQAQKRGLSTNEHLQNALPLTPANEYAVVGKKRNAPQQPRTIARQARSKQHWSAQLQKYMGPQKPLKRTDRSVRRR